PADRDSLQPHQLVGLAAVSRRSLRGRGSRTIHSSGKPPRRHLCVIPLELGERVKCLKFEILGGSERGNQQTCLAQPLPEFTHRASISIDQLWRKINGFVQQEHKPWLARDGGLMKLKFRVGLDLARHKGAVPETDDHHIHVAVPYPPPAVVGRLAFPGGEIPHIHRYHLCSTYRVQGCLHERSTLWKARHIRGVTHEHSAR